MSHETNALAQIHRQIMWNRLIAVVEEQAQSLLRTAFSPIVREAGDLSAGIFDRDFDQPIITSFVIPTPANTLPSPSVTSKFTI